LGGMLFNLTATDLGKAARELEAAAQAAEYDAAATCFARLVAGVPRLLAALQASTEPPVQAGGHA